MSIYYKKNDSKIDYLKDGRVVFIKVIENGLEEVHTAFWKTNSKKWVTIFESYKAWSDEEVTHVMEYPNTFKNEKVKTTSI